MLWKSLLRTIRKSLARYLAILSIIALGVGFFAGLRVTEQAMLKTANAYLTELNLYDFRLVSTLGFTEEDVAAFGGLDGVETAVGSVSTDVLTVRPDGSETVLHAHTLTEGINGLDITDGRLPEAPDECVLDRKFAGSAMLGQTISLSANNPETVNETFAYDRYTVVGIANSSAYINFERGTSSLGNGSVSGFFYLLPQGFDTDYYTEIYLSIPASGEIYSEEYDAAIDGIRNCVESLLEERAALRYRNLYTDVKLQLDEKQSEIDALRKTFGEIPQVLAAQTELDLAYSAIAEITPATVFALDRSSNVGYVSLESDTAIVSGVSKVFPLFFLLVAALVCITTMTRMVGEQRTQNGVLKALGYGNGAITGQYLFYAGSASIIGCVVGFLIGSKFMPMALWQVYHILYTIERPITFVLDWGLFALCTFLYLFCALGATFLVCRKDLRESSAQLIRPKAPSAGKRILLERVGFLWRHIRFLHKVSIRNILRYKKRMFMMIVGIGGCTALLLTGFGIRDSIQPIVDYQYHEIELYDAAVTFLSDADEAAQDAFRAETAEVTADVTFLHTGNIDAHVNGSVKSVNLVVFETAPKGFINLHSGETPVAFPGKGEAVVNYRFADDNGISVGDTIELSDSEYRTLTVTVTGIFDNYIYDYIYLSAETCAENWGSAPGCNTAYIHFAESMEEHEAGAVLLGAGNVAGVTLSGDMRTRVGKMLDSMNYIVLIVLVCAGALAFIVLYNLTNITITERARELATLNVLGFTPGEQNSYVFRENLILTAISSLCGIPMGIALLHYVMDQIHISTIYFGSCIAPLSFLLAILLTFIFTVVVDLALTAKIRNINMTEAMKAIE